MPWLKNAALGLIVVGILAVCLILGTYGNTGGFNPLGDAGSANSAQLCDCLATPISE
jgi:hypothetical protein